MTTPHYPMGCAAGSQERGDAAPSDPSARVVVWFDDGNVNNNYDNNRARARAVRVAGEYQGAKEAGSNARQDYQHADESEEQGITRAGHSGRGSSNNRGRRGGNRMAAETGLRLSAQSHERGKAEAVAIQRPRSVALAVPPGAGTLFHQLYDAYRRARRGKKPSADQLTFETQWADNLLELARRIEAGTWEPSPYTCFIATRPKAREIHAPAFADRVVHHWAIAQLEPHYERRFASCSYANRSGKGSHAAVDATRRYMRQVHSGQGGGWSLKLDVRNFFYSIDREVLWKMLKPAMQRFGTPLATQQVLHALLARPATAYGVRYRSTRAQRALVPRHKQLANAAPGLGLPIGNLPSQFLANVYMDLLDQFVKHRLRAKRYVRYVDDFVLFHRDRAVLEGWKLEIERFLQDQLELTLKDGTRLAPIADGIDFLGYVIYPTHTRVRRRVVAHANEALSTWERMHVRRRCLSARPEDLRRIRCVSASYQGHFRHADSFRLQRALHRRYPWLHDVTQMGRFHYTLENRTLRIRRTRDG